MTQTAPSPARDAVIHGLSTAEATRRAEAGQSNRASLKSERSVGAIVFKHTFTLFNFLNLALAACLFAVGSYRNMLFLGVVVSNTLIGVVQEVRAKRTHDRLCLLSRAKVGALRDGVETPLPTDELVLGDVVVLRRGNQVPADARTLSGEGEVNESLLTGESEPIRKQAGDALLSGSYLTAGELTAELTSVGDGCYAAALQAEARKVRRPVSELMRAMRTLIRVVSVALVPMGALLFAKQYFALHTPLDQAVPATVAAMIGMIPEGLILLTSVAMAVGVVRLGRRRTLVNELYGIETLARVDTLCLDKTGTITTGRMRVAETLPQPGATREEVAEAMRAFLAALPERSATNDALAQAFAGGDAPASAAPLYTVPFSSARKWSLAALPEWGALVLGAPDIVLDPVRDAALLHEVERRADDGMRVLALMRAPLVAPAESQAREDAPALPAQRAPMALIVVADTVRPDAPETFRYFLEQGVAIKVISGDNARTVSRVAREAGVPDAERFVDARTLKDEAETRAAATRYTVFGRVSPEQKRQLVEALQAAGHAVAMTGDGVNDIPALKAADCSIAMAGGSDAAGSVAHLTLLDANFSALPAVVLEGRRVINNIARASSLFLVKTTFSFLLSALLLILPFAYPFQPIQLTLISTLTIGVPSFFLALEPNKERVRGGFLRNVLRHALPGGLSATCSVLALLLLSGSLGMTEAQVSAMATILCGVSGLIALFFVCLPPKLPRMALVAVMAGAFVGAALLLPRLFLLESFPALPCAVICLCQVPFQLILRALLRKRREKETPRGVPA